MEPQDNTAAAAANSAGESLDTLAQLKADGLDILITFGTKLLIALAIIIIGFWITKRIVKLASRAMKARKVDETLHPFLRSSLNFLMRGLILIIAMSTMGMEMTSLIAVLGSIGLAVGLALQGSLANFAGGILILTLKPIRKGDFIEAQGVSGTVQEVNVISTTLLTLDFKTVFVPNGPLASGTITNYTRDEVRRVDLTFGIGYGDDIEKAKGIITDIATNFELTLNSPDAPFVRVVNLGDSSVDFTVRIWTKNENYWDVYFHMIENVKKAFDAQGISIPFPQRDVHLHQVSN
ncbi:MAG TPA: mechanosensitive ion channel [Bacteroidetes bacterium]|nr:mechanosensitive ion channel [Bacteroidota bacterium]